MCASLADPRSDCTGAGILAAGGNKSNGDRGSALEGRDPAGELRDPRVVRSPCLGVSFVLLEDGRWPPSAKVGVMRK